MIQPQSLVKSRYRVGRRLGEGGMALVFAGHDLLLGRDVAIKTLRPQFAADPAFRVRFEREARAAASLSHPHIIDIYDVGEADGAPFIVMELIAGQSLKEIIAAEAPFHPDDVAELMTQIASALDYAHARGYVHRDIKPGNILVDDLGRARVVDFGIAKGLSDADVTEAGTGLGTAGYLSAEQAAGLMATPASDIYSAGVVAFEMLTGELPFRAETPVGLAMRHVHDPPPPPSRFVPAIPPPVDAVVLRALDKDPTRRWRTAGAFADALRSWRELSERPVATVAGTGTTPRRTGSLVPTMIVALLVLGALAYLLWNGLRGLPGDGAAPAATAPLPAAPPITGGIDKDAPAGEIAPIIVPSTAAPEDAVGAPDAESAPTIAPSDGAAIVVPNLQGLTVAAATQAVLPRGLRIALDQPVYADGVPLNAVVDQDPPAGVAVAAGTVVRVALSRGPSPFPTSDQP
jgi:serine/threonine-protein kinase